MKRIILSLSLVISIAFCNEQDGEDFYKRGLDFKYGYNEKEKDLNFSTIWFKEAAKKGHIKSNLELGLLYYEEKDYVLAHEYFLKSYEESESKYYLSLMYENGYGVEINKEKSIQLLRAGREKYDNPKINLKLVGIEKKKKNYKEVELLLKEASNLGSKEAMKEYKEFCDKYNEICFK